MFSWEILQRALAGYRKGVANDLHMSGTLIDRWCHDPIDGDGLRNPMQTVLEIVTSLRRQGAPDADLIPTEIAAQLGFITIRLPERADQSFGQLGKLLKETGELVTAASEASADECETLDEKRRMLSELLDVLHVAGGWATKLRDEIAVEEKRCVSERFPPNYNGSLKTFFQKSR